MFGLFSRSVSNIYLISWCMPFEYFEESGMENCPFWMASVLSPKGKEKKHSL